MSVLVGYIKHFFPSLQSVENFNNDMLKEGKVLFNDALNTFYLRLYGVRHMVKDHSDSEKGNPLPPHRVLFPISSKVLLYASSHIQTSTAGTRNSSMGPP